MMSKRRHVIAAVVCAVMLLSLFVSSAYIVHETAHPHACAGEDCPVCRFIAQVGQLHRGFAAVLLVLAMAALVLSARREWRALVQACVPALCTPVGRKIRLNN